MAGPSLPPPTQLLGRWPALAALRIRNYRYFWTGLVLYVIGWRVEWVSFGWLIWELTHDPLYLGYYGLAEAVPLICFQLFGGVFADRTARLRLLIGTQCGTTAILVLACGLTATALIQVEHALLLTLLSGTFRAFEQPTRMALIPYLVDRAHLAGAIAIGSMPWQTGRILGPSIAGVLIAAFGPAVGFALAAAAYASALGLYGRIRLPPEQPAGDGQGLLRYLVEGFAFVLRNPLFFSLIGLTFVNSLFGMSYITLLPVFADRYLDAGASGFGLLQAFSGIGAVAGTLTLASLAHRLQQRGRFLLAGGIGFGLLLALFSHVPTFPLALAAITLMSVSNTFYLTLVNTVLQENVPNYLRGRVLGIYGLSFNLVPLGGLLAGALAAIADARLAVLLGGTVVAGVALLFLLCSRRLRTLA
jgi:MFS family permease